MSKKIKETGAFIVNDDLFNEKSELDEDIEYLRKKLKGKRDTGVCEW